MNNWKLPRPTATESSMGEGRYVDVKRARIHYLEQGKGDPIVFLHGNPTSSYLWRNIVPYVSEQGRAIAPDLIGMGRSSKPALAYRYRDHFDYLEAFLDALDLSRITLVGHDWGATLAFDYATRYAERVERIAFMEGVLPPVFPQPSFEAMGEDVGELFRALKDPVKGRQMVIDDNIFVEHILPKFVNRPLGPEAMREYRRPYLESATREPLLAWPREVPIAGEPVEIVELMHSIETFMRSTIIPVLLVYAEPGTLAPPELVPWYIESIENLETAFTGEGLHFFPEDSPAAIGRALSEWLRRN